jgi:hypothetical protein
MATYIVRGPRRAILRYEGFPNGEREGPFTGIIYRGEEEPTMSLSSN